MISVDQEKQWLLKEKYSNKPTEEYFADCKQIDNGTPLAYVIGHQPFLDCTIYLDSKPLIPRSETEHWIDNLVTQINKGNISYPQTILDLCAGSGCCGVALAKALPEAKIDFAEINASHLSTIRKNIEHNVSVQFEKQNKYQCIQSDLFSNLDQKYDLVVCNPPYIDKAMNTIDKNVHEHEPHEALYGGKNGLFFIEKILKNTLVHLTSQGQFWLEHEPEQAVAIQSICSKHNLSCTTHIDQYNTPRFSICNMSLY